MEKDNYNNIFENIDRFELKVSEGMAKIVEGINVMASSEALLAFVEFLQNIPANIKGTQFFGKVQELQKINLHYEDVVWLVEDFGISYTEETWQKLSECENDKSNLCRYIAKIIISTSMEKREKLIVLLAHIEPLIYETLEMSKGTNSKLKQDVKKVSIKENDGMSAENLGKVFVLAVMHIVFANTDSYTEEIDKRIPFRNNILHNGIVMYSDGDINIAYELLVDLIEILICVKEQMYE
jgi:hypothetical protein